ncbi:MAG: 4Fe-4S cluster-binding domain-containing protein [Monoglobus pectinilyticus]
MRLLNLADVLIDGKFIMSEKTLLLRFRGSKNQRMIDLKKTMESDGKTVYTFE